MEDREYFVEEAKSQRIVFKGTKEECEEWCDEESKNNGNILIIRKGQKKC